MGLFDVVIFFSLGPNSILDFEMHSKVLLFMAFVSFINDMWSLSSRKFKHKFSVFKQYYMYFYTFFYPYVFSKNLKTVV